MDFSAAEYLDQVSKYGAHKQMLDTFVKKKELIEHGDVMYGEDIEMKVLGDAGQRGSMHSIVNKICAPTLYQVRAGSVIVSNIVTDASVTTFTGSKFERSDKELHIDLGNRPWHVDWVTSQHTIGEQHYYRSDILGDGNKAGSYALEITKLMGTVAAGQIDKSTTAGIMYKKIRGTDLRHLFIKGALYQMLLCHLYTVNVEHISVGNVSTRVGVIPRDYITAGMQNGSELIVLRDVLSVETNTVLRLCAAKYPVLAVPNSRTKYTNVHLEADDLSIVSYDEEKELPVSPGIVLHPERWWEAMCSLAATLGGLEDLCYAYNFVIGWPDAYDILRRENLKVTGQYRIEVPKSCGVDTLFGDGPLRKVDTIRSNTNKLSSSNMAVLNRLCGANIVGVILDTIDDCGFADRDTYGDALANSELAHGVRLDSGLDTGDLRDVLVMEIVDRLGKRSAPYGAKYGEFIDNWPKLIHRAYRTSSDWEPVSICATEVSLMGPRKYGYKMGLLSEPWHDLEFQMGDVNYTRTGEKSWEISAWCVINGFYNRKWLMVGPLIASKVGLGPVHRVFEESRFTIGGKYSIASQNITVQDVHGKRGLWKYKVDRLDTNSYYQGAMSLIEAAFSKPEEGEKEEKIVIDTSKLQRETTLRHQPMTEPLDIDVRPTEVKPIDEVLEDLLGSEEFYEIEAKGEKIEDVVPGFGMGMETDVRIGMSTNENKPPVWCVIDCDRVGAREQVVMVSEGMCYRVKRSVDKPGVFVFRGKNSPLIHEKIRDADPAIIGGVILEAKSKRIESRPWIA